MIKRPRFSMSHLRRSESGTASIEFAFIGTVLILLTFGVFEVGRVAWTYQKLLNAVGGATRLVEMGASYTAIQDSISAQFSSGEQEALTFDIGPHAVAGVSYTRVHVRLALPLILPNLGIFEGNTVDVTALQLVPTS